MIYDWKSLGIWLNSTRRVQIEGLYIVRYVSHGWAEWMFLGLCLFHWLMTWILCVCACGKRQRAALLPVLSCSLRNMEKKQCLCCRDHGDLYLVDSPWICCIPHCNYHTSSAWCVLGCFHGLEKSSPYSVKNSKTFPVSPADRENKVLIFVASKKEKKIQTPHIPKAIARI